MYNNIYRQIFKEYEEKKRKDILHFYNNDTRFLIILRKKYKNKRSYIYKYLSSLHFVNFLRIVTLILAEVSRLLNRLPARVFFVVCAVLCAVNKLR